MGNFLKKSRTERNDVAKLMRNENGFHFLLRVHSPGRHALSPMLHRAEYLIFQLSSNITSSGSVFVPGPSAWRALEVPAPVPGISLSWLISAAAEGEERPGAAGLSRGDPRHQFEANLSSLLPACWMKPPSTLVNSSRRAKCGKRFVLQDAF